MRTYVFFITYFLMISHNVFAQEYKLPPTSSVHHHVPWIADEQMEICVEKYNKAEWLEKEMNGIIVNQYNQSEVLNYNAKVAQHSGLINYFNSNCAGKQSKSAYMAALKLNIIENCIKNNCSSDADCTNKYSEAKQSFPQILDDIKQAGIINGCNP